MTLLPRPNLPMWLGDSVAVDSAARPIGRVGVEEARALAPAIGVAEMGALEVVDPIGGIPNTTLVTLLPPSQAKARSPLPL